MVYDPVIYGCKNWTVKKAEHWRTDAFELWWWRTLESPLNFREIKPVNPKGNQPWTSLEGLMLKLKLKLQSSNELTQKRPWCWEGPKAEGEWDDRGDDGWMTSLIQWTWVWARSGKVKDWEVLLQSIGVTKYPTWLSDEQKCDITLLTM